MKITDIETIPLHIPLKETVISDHPLRFSNHILVKIQTDEGITGYGQGIHGRFNEIYKAYFEQRLKPIIIGQNPFQIEKLSDAMSRLYFGRAHFINASSAIEIALWDIVGKARHLPVYEMLGGPYRDKIRAYASLMEYRKPDEAAEAALQWVEEGYTAIKLHQRAWNALESVKTVRDAVGTDVALMLDVNGAWNRKRAIKVANALERYDLLWLEEPIWPVDDWEGLARLRDRTNIQIAGGEGQDNIHAFKEILDKGALDIIQPDVLVAGGISTCRKIFALAEAFNVQVATHSFFYGPAMAATVQLGISSVNSEWVEVNAVPLEEYFIDPPVRPREGFIKAPDKIGLGFAVDENVINRRLKI